MPLEKKQSDDDLIESLLTGINLIPQFPIQPRSLTFCKCALRSNFFGPSSTIFSSF